MMPIRTIFPDALCARAAGGHAAVPPRTDMNWRLPMLIAIRPLPNGATRTGMPEQYHASILGSVAYFTVYGAPMGYSLMARCVSDCGAAIRSLSGVKRKSRDHRQSVVHDPFR